MIFSNCSNVTLFSSKASGEIYPLDSVETIDLSQVSEEENYPVFTNFGKEMSFECSIENTSELNEIFDNLFPAPSTKMMATIKWPYLIPVRYNKRKRIQKKWNKRYGMKTAYKNKDVEFKQSDISDNHDGTFTFDFTGCFA